MAATTSGVGGRNQRRHRLSRPGPSHLLANRRRRGQLSNRNNGFPACFPAWPAPRSCPQLQDPARGPHHPEEVRLQRPVSPTAQDAFLQWSSVVGGFCVNSASIAAAKLKACQACAMPISLQLQQLYLVPQRCHGTTRSEPPTDNPAQARRNRSRLARHRARDPPQAAPEPPRLAPPVHLPPANHLVRVLAQPHHGHHALGLAVPLRSRIPRRALHRMAP